MQETYGLLAKLERSELGDVPSAEEAGFLPPLEKEVEPLPISKKLPITGPRGDDARREWLEFYNNAPRGNAVIPMNYAKQDNTLPRPLTLDTDEESRLPKRSIEVKPATVEKVPVGQLTLPDKLYLDNQRYKDEINSFQKDKNKYKSKSYEYDFETPLAQKYIKEDARPDPTTKTMMDKFWGYYTDIGEDIIEASDKTGMAESLLYAMIVREGGGPGISSRKGAIGYGQFTPITRQEMRRVSRGSMQQVLRDVDLSEEAFANNGRTGVMAMAVYMRRLLDMFDGNLEAALSAYNGGPGATKANGVLKNEQTLTYVYFIKEYEKYYRKLLHSFKYGTKI